VFGLVVLGEVLVSGYIEGIKGMFLWMGSEQYSQELANRLRFGGVEYFWLIIYKGQSNCHGKATRGC